MATQKTEKFTIVGCGLAGALLANFLAKDGYSVDLYERRSDPRKAGAERGRSINLALSTRGIAALQEVGLAEKVLNESLPMRGRMMHARTGELTFQPYGVHEDDAIRSVSRADLNLTLFEAAEKLPNVQLFFDQRCVGFDVKANEIEFVNTMDLSETRVPADIIVGADGAFSAVRSQLQKQDRFNYHQEYLSHSYKELSIPAGPSGAFQLQKDCLHIWPRHSFMMIALPNIDGSFTCTLFYAATGEQSFEQLESDVDVLEFFHREFPDALRLMPTVCDDFRRNPVGSLVTIRCSPFHWGDKVVMIGDAAHAVVPFYGQGMNASFEDCSVLRECLRRVPDRRDLAFEEYELRRKPNVDALADLAVENFYEMRDKVASKAFLWRKKLEKLLARTFPRWYLPLYSMITFSRIPYAEARRRAKQQDRIVIGVVGAIVGFLFLLIFVWLIRR